MKLATRTACALALSLPVAAQADVVINEVLYDPAGTDDGRETIEIANLGDQAQTLDNWALCVSASAPGSRVYWRFPNGIRLDPGAILQVRWRTVGANTANELFTGTPNLGTCFNSFTALDNAKGAVALYRTSRCAGFFSPANIVDFVQWGGGGTIRESVAVGAGIWTAMTFVADVPDGSSIAYDGDGNSSDDWFRDACPTPGLANTTPGNATLTHYGVGCAGGQGVPSIDGVGGPPALGNRSFGIALGNAPAGTGAVLVVGANQTSFPLLGCTLLVVPLGTVATVTPSRVDVPLSCNAGQVGTDLFLQWAVIDNAAPQGVAFSRGLQVTL